MKLSQSNFNLRLPDSDLVCSYLIAAVMFRLHHSDIGHFLLSKSGRFKEGIQILTLFFVRRQVKKRGKRADGHKRGAKCIEKRQCQHQKSLARYLFPYFSFEFYLD